MKFILIITFFIISLLAQSDKAYIRGEKIYNYLCDQPKIDALLASDVNLTAVIQVEDICGKINEKNIDYLLHYLSHRTTQTPKAEIIVPEDAKCPVCGMFTAKYPKWIAQIALKNGDNLYFDGAKDMLKFYFDPARFQHPDVTFEKILVLDFYTLSPLPAQNAWYVVGSNVYGPMGHEFIPFKTQEDANRFLQEHHGKKILSWDSIDEALVYSLDQ